MSLPRHLFTATAVKKGLLTAKFTLMAEDEEKGVKLVLLSDWANGDLSTMDHSGGAWVRDMAGLHAFKPLRSRSCGLSMSSPLRVDCYAGGDGALVRCHEGQGFLATDTFTVPLPTGPWPGQVLQRRLAQPA